MVKLLGMLLAMAKKECLQLSRDRLTAALLISVPVAQILLFGFAIELSPRQWPGAWVSVKDVSQTINNSPTDQLIQEKFFESLKKSEWLHLPEQATSEAAAQSQLVRGDIKFILYWPEQASTYLRQHQAIPITLIGDSSDPYVSAATALITRAFQQNDVSQANKESKTETNSIDQNQQSKNPSADSSSTQSTSIDTGAGRMTLTTVPKFSLAQGSGAYLVPALTGVILTLTLTLMAAFSLVRERERGTWDGLLSTPANASVIVFGKLLPYLGIGLLLFGLLQFVAHGLFGSHFASSAQWIAALGFMLGQLGLGACLSLLASTQMQAMQLGVFFYLPSILLSGFMFPFHAMPAWARQLGELLPLTHFLRVLRADLFRQASSSIQLSLAIPIFIFACLMLLLAVLGYRRRIT